MGFDWQPTVSRSADRLRDVRLIIAAIIGLLALNGWLALVHIYAHPLASHIDTSQIRPELGNAFLVQIKAPFPYSVTNDADNGSFESRLVLFEDGNLLGPPHSLHAQIRTEGRGRYSHWENVLYFSTSDSTDPRTNGRLYRFLVPTHVSALVRIPVLLLDLAAILFAAGLLKRRLESRTRFRLLLTSDAAVRPATKLLLASTTVLGAFALAQAIGTQYKSNDDVDLRMIAEAQVGDGTQTEFLLYQSILIGKVLRALYRLQSSIPWYDLELAACALLGALLGLVGVLRICKSRANVAFVLITAVLIFTPIYRAFQFTASAIVLSGGAVLMFLSVWQARPAKRAYLWAINTLIVAAFFVGSLVRFHAAFFCLLALLPLIALIKPRPAIRFALSQMTTLMVAVAISAAAAVYNVSYYARSPGWENFWKDANARANAWQFTNLDRSRPDEIQSALSAARWTVNDYALLSNWLYMDPTLFSNDRVVAFAEHVPQAPKLLRIRDTYDVLTNADSRLPLFAFLCFAPVLVGITIGSIATAGAAFVWFIGVLFVTGVIFKASMLHILWPFYAVCVLGCAASIFSQTRAEARHRNGLLAAAVLVGMLYLTGLEIRQWFVSSALDEDTRKRLAYDLAVWPLQPGATVVVWDNNFPYEVWAHPFYPIPRVSFRFLHTNDVSVSPHSADVYSTLGTRDVAWAMCHIPGVVLVDARIGYADLHARMLETYMHEHYNETVELDQLYDGNALTLYSCRLKYGGVRE